MPRCRSCGKEILFIDTPRGKKIPVDADSLGTFYPHLDAGKRVVTAGGEVFTIKKGGAAVYGYESHFASCPQANDWRKR